MDLLFLDRSCCALATSTHRSPHSSSLTGQGPAHTHPEAISEQDVLATVGRSYYLRESVSLPEVKEVRMRAYGVAACQTS